MIGLVLHHQIEFKLYEISKVIKDSLYLWHSCGNDIKIYFDVSYL